MAKTKALNIEKKAKPAAKKEAGSKPPVKKTQTKARGNDASENISFQQFLEFAPVAFIAVDEKSIIQFANAHAEELFGYTRKQLIGQDFEFLIPERFRSSHDKKKKKYLAIPQKRDIGTGLEVFCRRRDGIEVPVEIGLNPVDINGAIYVLASIVNISVRKQAEKDLNDSYKKYLNLFENSLDAILVTDNNQRYIDANPAACELLGYEKAELLTKKIGDIVASSVEIKDQLWGDFIQDKNQKNTIFLKRKDGRLILTEYTAVANFLPGMHMSFSRDITDRQRMENALRDSEERFRSLSEAAFEGLMIHDKGIILTANQKFAELLGFKNAGEIIGKNAFETLPLTPHSLERLKTSVGKNLIDALEIEVYQKDGSTYPAETQGRNIFFKGRHARIVTMRDITLRKQAEKKLRDSEKRLDAILQTLMDGVVMVSTQGEIIFANHAAETILGIKKDNIEGKYYNSREWQQLDEFGNPYPLDQLPLARAMREGRPVEAIEHAIVAPDGEQKWLTVNAAPLFDEQGKLYGAIAGFQDSTKRKKIEQQLVLNTRAIESVEQGIIITDPSQPDNPIIYSNHGFTNITGYPPDEIIGTNCRFLQGPGTNPDTLKKLSKCIEERSAFEGEILNYKKDGTPFWNYLRISHIVNANGQVTHMVGFQSDITARKKAETQYRTLVEQNPAIIYTASLHQHIGVTYISPQIKSLGFTQEEWIADPELWFRQIHPEDKKRVLEDIERYSTAGSPFHSEYRLAAKNGEIRWFLDEALDVFDDHGVHLLRQGFMLDITARKIAEEALSARERYLSLLNKTTTLIISSQDLNELAEGLVTGLKELLGADDCYMTRWDDETGTTIPLGTTAKMDQPYQTISIPSTMRSMTGSVINEARLLVAEDVFNSPYISPDLAKLFPARSMLGIPLLYGNTKIGAILVAYNTPHKFEQSEIDRAEQTGRQIAIALWSAQQDFELKKRLKEQQTLAQITTTLSQVERIGLSNVLDLIVHSARELIPEAQQGVIHLMDKEQAFLISEAVSGFEQFEGTKSKMRIGEGIAGLVIANGKSIYIPSVMEDDRFINVNPNATYQSLLVSPIFSGSQKLGTISVQSEKQYAFSTNEINLLNELGQQAAIAIENARLYDAAQQELAERIQAEAALRSSEERYRSVSEDIPAMICRFRLDGTITYVNQLYGQFFGKQPFELLNVNLLTLIEEEQERERVKLQYLSLTRENPFIMYEVNETNSLGEKRWVQWTDRLIFNNDDKQVEFQSIGTDVTEHKLAEIEREHLLNAEHEQRLLAETSANATLALVSHTETDKVLYEILNQVQKLLPGCAANIALLDNDVLRTTAWRGYEDRGDEIFPNLLKQTDKFTIDQKMLKDPRPYLVRDTHADPDWQVIPGLEWIRSHLMIPLIWNNELLGLLYIDEDMPNKFTEETADRLKPLVNATTVALESALLIETTRQALKETSALYHINQGLVALNVDELLQEAVELLQNNFNYYHVQVFVRNPASGNFLLKAASGETGKKLVDIKHEVQVGAGIVGYAADTGVPFFTNNVDEVVFFAFDPNLPNTKAEMAIPVRNGEKLYGILDIQQTAGRPFTPRDQQLVVTVADQLAIALHKAELYENLQTSLNHEKNIRNQLVQNERLAVMGRLLASVSHELNNPLQAIQNALFLLKEEKGISEQGLNDLDIVLAESERMAGLIERLRDTYRPPQVEDLQPTHVNNIIEDVHTLLATHLRKNEVAFEFHPDPDVPAIMALPDQIRQVALNLLVNAVEAMTNGGKLTVSTQFLEDSQEVMLSVSDTGSGIAPAVLPNIFDPFVTNKKRGTGIGLTISHDIVIKHRGRITAENNADVGATFKVWLPVESTPAETE